MKKCGNCGKETNDLYFYDNMWICEECLRKVEEHYTSVAKKLGRLVPPEKHREMNKGYIEDLK